jgi:hypothetical protein
MSKLFEQVNKALRKSFLNVGGGNLINFIKFPLPIIIKFIKFPPPIIIKFPPT